MSGKRRVKERIPTKKPLPTQYYPQEDAELTLKLAARGFTNNQIAYAIVYEFPENHGQGKLTSARHHNARRKVANILREPEAWNPFMDEERIHTAFMCDVLAYDSLTHYERRELFERLYDLHSKGLPHPKFPSNGTNWLREWCRAVEENPSLLSNRINKRQGADTKRLPKKFADGRPITDEIMRAVVTEYRETGMNQKALAKKFGMSHASLGAIINFYEL